MGNTAKVIELFGDPKKPESAEHIITFPGGSISVCRTSKNEYWAHIKVNHDQKIDDIKQFSKNGEIKMIRIDTIDGVKTIDFKNTDHFAVLIGTN